MLRGKLMGKNLGDKLRLFYYQRGDTDENRNVPVKIYRREAPEIQFCNDLAGMAYGHWYEYVDNQSHLDPRVKVIFEGTLPLVNSINEYIDTDVEIGQKYIYWVEADSFGEHTILGPLALKVRSREAWWPYDMWVAEMNRIKQKYGDLVKLQNYGYTAMRRPIPGMVIGNQDRVIALMGAVHASETGPEMLLKVVQYMLTNQMTLLKKFGIALMPAINIDVREHTVDGFPFYERLNHNGVDLNRNFDHGWREDFVYGVSNEMFGATTYHGPRPNSESEAEASIAFLEDVKPVCLYVYDNGSVITEDKIYYNGIPATAEVFDYATQLSYIYSKAFRTNTPETGTFTAEPISFPYDEIVFKTSGPPNGTLDGWAYQRFNIPAFNMQFAYSEEGMMCLNDDTTPELLNRWALRHAHALCAVMQEMIDNPFVPTREAD